MSLFNDKVAIFYGDKHENSAEHTFEVFMNELSFFQIPFEQVEENTIVTEEYIFYFQNVTKDDYLTTNEDIFNTTFLTNDLKKEYEEHIKIISEKVQYIGEPTNCIIDLVMLVKKKRSIA